LTIFPLVLALIAFSAVTLAQVWRNAWPRWQRGHQFALRRLASSFGAGYCDFFGFVQRLRCAAAILWRASAERVLFAFGSFKKAATAAGRSLRFVSGSASSDRISRLLKTIYFRINGSDDVLCVHPDAITAGLS
jgi:hypothetical protein